MIRFFTYLSQDMHLCIKNGFKLFTKIVHKTLKYGRGGEI